VKRGFKGLTEVAALSDQECRNLVLGNWHKLNSVLMTKPRVSELQRLLSLEVCLGKVARPHFIVRLVRAIAGSHRRARDAALIDVLKDLRNGRIPEADKLVCLGLAPSSKITKKTK
jgi:hypothetical protein